MPTLNKLQYLDETKAEIKNALNTKFNSQIQDSDTFRSYVDKIQNIYTNWPKVTGENTILSLSPTRKGKLVLNLKGNTSQDGTPTPDSPQDIHVVSGDNNVKIQNKNLFDKDNTTTQVAYFTGTGAIITGGNSTITTSYTRIEPNTQMYLSGGNNVFESVCYYDKDKNFIERELVASSSKSINKDAYYIRFQITTTSLDLNTIQLEYGSTATSYIAHQEQNYPINLPSGMELCKIGTYQDYFYKENDKWYLYKEIGKVVLNGSENWQKGSNTHQFYLAKPSNMLGASPMVINYFVNQETASNNGMWASTNFIQANHLAYTVVADFKTWLSTHNTEVYYILATPTNTEITDTTLITQLNNLEKALSYQGQTNISQVNNDLAFIISASALKGSE